MKKPIAILLLALTILSCSKKTGEKTEPAVNFSNVLILGNSITYSPKNPGIGWQGEWGMAATKAELDFVHILTKDFQEKNSSCTVTAKNIAAFEVNYTTYDFESELKQYKDSKPDLIILRIGENVKQETFDPVVFEKRYVELLNYFKSNNPSVRFFGAGSFWGNAVVDQIMARHSEFITLSPLVKDPTNAAWGIFDDPGVASHPSDKGMKAIADLIWSAVVKLK